MTTTTKTNTAIETTTTDRIATGANQATLGVLVCMAGLVGIWGVVCMVSALAQSGGIVEMARNYMAAIGM